MCREASGLPEFTVKPVKFQNGVCKAVAACAPDSFIVLKYYTVITPSRRAVISLEI